MITAKIIFTKALVSSSEYCTEFNAHIKARENEAINEDGRPKIAVYSITDEGSKLIRALKLLKSDGVIENFIPCFNHNTQNVIKDGIAI